LSLAFKILKQVLLVLFQLVVQNDTVLLIYYQLSLHICAYPMLEQKQNSQSIPDTF